MTLTGLTYRLARTEIGLKKLYCYVQANSGGDIEVDPVFTVAPAFSITQTDIDNWNAGATAQDLQSVLGTGNLSNNDLNLINGASLFTTGLNVTNSTNNTSANFDVSTITNNITLGFPTQNGTLALVSQIPTGIPQIVRINDDDNYDLIPTKSTILITFTGATNTLNLPLVAPNIGTIMLLYNKGTGDATITGNVADGNVVIDGGIEGPSSILTAGSPMTIFNDGFNWITKP